MPKNREIAEIIFDAIRKMGYKPYNIDYGDGYFIFDMGQDSVVHFRLKGVWKHWKFGMWVSSEYLDEKYREEEKGRTYDERYEVVQLFAQYDTQIDKFKPSRSALCVKYYASEWNKHIDGTYKSPWWKIEKMLGMMKRHPLMCYAEFCGEYTWYYNGSFLAEFIKYESKDKISKIRESINTAFWLPYTKLKIFLSQKSNVIDTIELYDFEKENPGWRADYKYQVRITFSEDATDEQMCKWLNFWFKKDKYGKSKTFEYVIELGGFRKNGEDKPFTFVRGE